MNATTRHEGSIIQGPVRFGWRLRLGMLLPSSNQVAEPELPSMLPDGVAVHTTRLKLAGGGRDELLRMTEKIEEAADLVAAFDKFFAQFPFENQLKAMAPSSGRSRSKPATKVAANICVSAAEPPLPQASTLPPPVTLTMINCTASAMGLLKICADWYFKSALSMNSCSMCCSSMASSYLCRLTCM